MYDLISFIFKKTLILVCKWNQQFAPILDVAKHCVAVRSLDTTTWRLDVAKYCDYAGRSPDITTQHLDVTKYCVGAGRSLDMATQHLDVAKYCVGAGRSLDMATRRRCSSQCTTATGWAWTSSWVRSASRSVTSMSTRDQGPGNL